MAQPFILLDDARVSGAADARYYASPFEIVCAHRIEDVLPAIARLRTLSAAGAHLAGMLAYEAGYALEPRLAPLGPARTAAPLLWFGAFDGCETIPAAAVPGWLHARADPARADPAHVSLGPLAPRTTPGAYRLAFDALRQAIADGDIYQANLTFPMAGGWRGDPLAIYAALRPAAQAGYGGIVHDGSRWQLSFSPELFFAIAGGTITTRPMKGTRARGRDAREDAARVAELAASAKDRAENLMILDLMRNDLSRLAVPGSVAVERPFAVETYPTVHQMVSTVHAALRPGCDALDALGALFPCGSITGAPKIRAMELIAAAEPGPRGVYCGTIGRIDPPRSHRDGAIEAGEAVFNVAIRTLCLEGGSGRAGGGSSAGGRAVLGVGSAVVADSVWLAEWRECLVKAQFAGVTPRSAVAGFDLFETMLVEAGLDAGKAPVTDAATGPGLGPGVDPGMEVRSRVPLLAAHLGRLEASAHALGFACDRAAIEQAVFALVAGPGGTEGAAATGTAARLRLALSRGGAFALELSPMPPALPSPAGCVALRLPVDPGDLRLRHKTTDRAFYDEALAVARRCGADEALLVRDDDLVTEGGFTNVFVAAADGLLLTPPASLGLLPGVLRATLLADGRAREAALTLQDLAGGFLIGNALRGLVPARLMPDPSLP